MAALTSASWTVTISRRDIEGKRKKVTGSVVLAGTDTYPTGGIPLPAKEQFGFKRNMDNFIVVGQAGATTQYQWMYDRTNHKLQAFFGHDTAGVTTLPNDEADVAEVPGARTLFFETSGW